MDTSEYNPDESLLEINLDLASIKEEITRVQGECSRRGLFNTTKWLAEINYAIRSTALPPDTDNSNNTPELAPGPELDTYNMAKSYFDLKEYDRAQFFTKDLKSNLSRFLHFYSR